MNLVVTHYHLETGGVTHVIAGHLRSLAATWAEESRPQILILHGGAPCEWSDGERARWQALDVELVCVPELGYDDDCKSTSARLGPVLMGLLDERHFTPENTLIHAHNHSLGKNVAAPDALAAAAERGFPLLLQIHDFAEDFRPDNYRRLVRTLGGGDAAAVPRRLYPQASHIHYAALNVRDASLLAGAGVAPDRLHVLPNPVVAPGPLPPAAQARRRLEDRFAVSRTDRFVVYPVRCIRRKNIGETLLWSALAPEGTRFGLTLAPTNPKELPAYRRWESLGEELRLPCSFDIGGTGGLDFSECLAAADTIVTTSVAEGFGMAFLESWLTGRGLIGRDLPEITADFKSAGVRLDALHPRLDVPLHWLGKRRVHESFEQRYRETLSAYARPQPSTDRLHEQLAAATHGDSADFATLTVSLQAEIIRMLSGDESRQHTLTARNPWMAKLLADHDLSRRHLNDNSRIIAEHYSDAACGRRLQAIYRTLMASPRAHELTAPAHGAAVLDGFLNVTRFHPIRVEA